MAGVKRTRFRIAGQLRAEEAARAAGAQVKASRTLRRLTQDTLAKRVGISRPRIADLEAGRGANASLTTWFAVGEALGRPFKAEFLRDRLEQPIDAGHLEIQELVLRVGKQAGYDRRFELAARPLDPARSSDAALLDRSARRMILAECWNSFGDLGAAARSSDRKLAEAGQLSAALGDENGPLQVGLVWVVRDTARNRELIGRYRHIFEARFPGSSVGWVNALVRGRSAPAEPGLIWCDVRATRLFAWRRLSGSSRCPCR
jgi:transcriptional regulator with XRE-family HTH domain